MIPDVVLAGVLGVGLGAVTGIPIGVVNVAIVEAATRGQLRYATGIGLGGSLADGVHAALAFVGVGQLVAAHPAWSRALAIVAAIAVAAYAITIALRTRKARPRDAVADAADAPAPPQRGGRARGFAIGLALTLPNPAALGAWVAVAAALWPDIALAPAVAFAAGVVAGSAAWFTLLARWVAQLPANSRVARVLPGLAIVLLVAVALVGITRAALFDV